MPSPEHTPSNHETQTGTMRFPALCERLQEIAETLTDPLDITILGIGVEESPGCAPPQLIEVMSVFAGRNVRYRVVDKNEEALKRAEHLDAYCVRTHGAIPLTDPLFASTRRSLERVLLTDAASIDTVKSGEAKVVAVNREALGGNRVEPIHGDFREIDFHQLPSDIVISTGSLHYLTWRQTPDEREAFFAKLLAALQRKDSRMLVDMTCIFPLETWTPKEEIERVRKSLSDKGGFEISIGILERSGSHPLVEITRRI